jgi:hypothetical protein
MYIPMFVAEKTRFEEKYSWHWNRLEQKPRSILNFDQSLHMSICQIFSKTDANLHSFEQNSSRYPQLRTKLEPLSTDSNKNSSRYPQIRTKFERPLRVDFHTCVSCASLISCLPRFPIILEQLLRFGH